MNEDLVEKIIILDSHRPKWGSSKLEPRDAGEMADPPTREEIEAKFQAAQERTEKLFFQLDGKIDSGFAKIDGKIDRMSDRLDANMDRLSDTVGGLSRDVAQSRSEFLQEARFLRQDVSFQKWWVVGTGVAIIAIVIGILAFAETRLQTGLSAAPPQIMIMPVQPPELGPVLEEGAPAAQQ